MVGPGPLDPERRIQHRAAGVRGQGPQPGVPQGLDARVEDGVDPRASGGIREDVGGDPGPVQGAVGLEGLRPEG